MIRGEVNTGWAAEGDYGMSEAPRRSNAAFLALVALVVLGLTPQSASAWGNNGHRIVGQGAEEALSTKARQAVRRIAGTQSLAMLAPWPDFARSDPAWRFATHWHYTTVEDGQSLAEVLARSARTLEPDNLVEAIGYFTAILAGDTERRRNFEELMRANKAEPLGGSVELTALSFLSHFIGDVHQPLHVGRGGAQGGNNIAVEFFGEVKKLHSVWDSAIIEKQGLSFTEFTDFLQAEFAGQLDPGSGGPEAWAQESIDYRHRLYELWNRTSRDTHLPELSYGYVYDHIGTIKRRLYLGGLRLARQLDSIFD
jgi:hypothetical protein